MSEPISTEQYDSLCGDAVVYEGVRNAIYAALKQRDQLMASVAELEAELEKAQRYYDGHTAVAAQLVKAIKEPT